MTTSAAQVLLTLVACTAVAGLGVAAFPLQVTPPTTRRRAEQRSPRFGRRSDEGLLGGAPGGGGLLAPRPAHKARKAPAAHEVIGVHGTVIQQCLDADTLRPAFRSRRDDGDDYEGALGASDSKPFVEDYEATAPCNDGHCTFKTRSRETADEWRRVLTEEAPYPYSAWSLPSAGRYLRFGDVSEALERATAEWWDRQVEGLTLCSVDAVPKAQEARGTMRVVCPCKATVEELGDDEAAPQEEERPYDY